MKSTADQIAAGLRSFERRIGIDREGRTVWVWLMPPAVGLVAAALVPFMPGLPDAMGFFDRLVLAVFALITMTAIASIYLISFDNDHNQEARTDDPPGRGGSGGSDKPPAPSGPPPPPWLRQLDDVTDDAAEPVTRRPRRRPRVPTEVAR